MLVIPWLGRYLLGTTDIRFDEDPDEARCDADEMAYILGEVNALIPGAGPHPGRRALHLLRGAPAALRART